MLNHFEPNEFDESEENSVGSIRRHHPEADVDPYDFTDIDLDCFGESDSFIPDTQEDEHQESDEIPLEFTNSLRIADALEDIANSLKEIVKFLAHSTDDGK